MRVTTYPRLTLALSLLWLTACTTSPVPTTERPTSWAQPVAHAGLPNLYKVSDALYRGAQPTQEGFEQLAAMGMKTVINARQDDTDRDLIARSGMTYVRLPMSAWDADDRDVIQFLRIVADPSATPVFVHCHRGADRSGLLCAMYRVAIQGWSKDEAIAEMTRGGMGFHGVYGNLATYIRDADVEQIRRDAGLAR